MKTVIKIVFFPFKQEKKCVKIANCEIVEFSIEGEIVCVKNGQEIEVVGYYVRPEAEDSLFNRMRFARFRELVQLKAEEIVSEAFDDFRNYIITKRKIKEIFEEGG